jgi:uroporphyrin-III C-methyltransferase / precorrin-2 dehydrogenase / sirohydrochlorin ferrochelatase
MNQLPIFVNLRGVKVVLVGDGDAALAKRRLIERAGGICVGDCPNAMCACARIAFIAIDDENEALAAAHRLRGKGLLVNVVDRPEQCDFTTPAIIDRDPVLIAIGTGGASAGLAKALRQKLEVILPQSLGALAAAVSAARDVIRGRWPDSAGRRRALDAAFQPGGRLDPMVEHDISHFTNWLASDNAVPVQGLIDIHLTSTDPEDLTLRVARLLGEADHIFYVDTVPECILNRARADAVRHAGEPALPLPGGLVLQLLLPVQE